MRGEGVLAADERAVGVRVADAQDVAGGARRPGFGTIGGEARGELERELEQHERREHDAQRESEATNEPHERRRLLPAGSRSQTGGGAGAGFIRRGPGVP